MKVSLSSFISAVLCLVLLLALFGCGGGSGSHLLSSTPENLGFEQDATQVSRDFAPLDQPVLAPGQVEDGLAQLDRLAPLQGVEPDLQQSLVAALREAFLNLGQGSRMVSGIDNWTTVQDFRLRANLDGSASFYWSYRNSGDYDQNSEVGIADLSVIGLFFGETIGGDNWPRAVVADGDANGEINHADVVPIAANFQRMIDAYTIFQSGTPEDEGSWTALATVGFSEGFFVESTGIKQFTFQLENPEQGMSYFVQAGGSELAPDPAKAAAIARFDASDFGKPQNLSATQGTVQNQVQLTWDELENTLLYEIFGSDTSDGEFAKLGSKAPGSPQYFDFSVEAGQHKFYFVRGLLEAGYSENSDVVEGWPLGLPGAPQNVDATDGDHEDKVVVTWSPVATATAYQVSRADTADGEFTALGTTELPSFTDETTDWGLAYYYQVQAINPVGVSEPSTTEQGNRGELGSPPVVISVSPLTATEGLLQTFSANISGNPPESYLWDFGGAATTSTQASPTVQVGAPGTYDCSLTVANAWGGGQFEFTLNINAQNSSISEVTPISGVESTYVTFSATYSGDPATGWSWDFGGGAVPDSSTEATPTVQLGAIGTYNASVEIQTSSGSDQYFFTLTVVAGLPNITEVSPTGGNDGQSITLAAVNTGGSIDTWEWNFGGGAIPNTSSLESPTILLDGGGNYNCSLRTTNSKGSSTFLFVLNVIPPAPIITNVSPTSGVAGTAISPSATNEGGVATSYAWYFGGGASPNSSAQEHPTINLGAEGSYSCTLVATNISGSVLFPFTLTVSAPPPNLTGVAPNTGVSGATLAPLAANTGGPATSWSWNFGGGATPNTSTSATPVITLGNPGNYSATVTATNSEGSSSVNFTLAVNVAAPEISSVSPQAGYAGATVSFEAANNGGAASSWAWNFGGGATPNTSQQQSPSVVLGAVGTYNCSVIATNASGSDTFTFSLTLTSAPPNITAVTPLSGSQGASVTFTPTNTGGTPTSWTWSFDGGGTPNSSTDQSPTITLGSAGTYNMNVTAQNSSGSSQLAFSFEVLPNLPDITAVTPLSGVEGTSFSPVITNAGGAISSWSWSFGGGATPNASNVESPTVTLTNEGTYSASVTGTNAAGSDTYNFTLTVNPEAPDLTNVDTYSGVTGTTYTPTATNVGGSVTTWAWNFGGGASPNTSSAATPSVTLGAIGTYSASVTATNVTGSDTFNFTLTVNPQAPDISAVTPISGVTGTVFSPVPTNIGGAATSWVWNFGGGASPNSSSDQNPGVTLGAVGTYSASVTATNVTGSDTYNFTLTVNPQAPNITGVSPTSGSSGSPVQFTVSNSGGAGSSWAWNFGGGANPNTSAQESPTVNLGAAGTYNCSVTVTNATGSDTFNFTLTIT